MAPVCTPLAREQVVRVRAADPFELVPSAGAGSTCRSCIRATAAPRCARTCTATARSADRRRAPATDASGRRSFFARCVCRASTNRPPTTTSSTTGAAAQRHGARHESFAPISARRATRRPVTKPAASATHPVLGRPRRAAGGTNSIATPASATGPIAVAHQPLRKEHRQEGTTRTRYVENAPTPPWSGQRFLGVRAGDSSTR